KMVLLIELGFDKNLLTGAGKRPLVSLAIYYGFYDAAKVLIESGADKTICDRNGLSPLDYAKNNNCPEEIIKILEC
ncbi:MAG: ankyrin repeat domain-containing protein, partial [Treponemataceae bacterium]|nr:ankyrin repeat domain-containing protein [Treponemataceae bacterium]